MTISYFNHRKLCSCRSITWLNVEAFDISWCTAKAARCAIFRSVAADRIHAYLERLGHQLANPKAPLFVLLRHWTKGLGVTANGIYTLVEAYARKAGIQVDGVGVHGLRATAATNALEHEADIASFVADAQIGLAVVKVRLPKNHLNSVYIAGRSQHLGSQRTPATLR